MFLRYELQEIGTTLVVENWTDGLRCICLDEQRVQFQDAHLPLPLSHLPEAFLALIPVALQQAAAPYGELALRLLCLARQHKPSAELLLSRPVLLLLDVMYWPHDNQPILKNISRGQRALLQAMGLPARRSLLRFLDRLRLDLDRDWQRDYLCRWLYQRPDGYQSLRHEPEILPAQLFLLFHAPELTSSPLAQALRFDYEDLSQFSCSLNTLNPALALARAGRFPGGWPALRAMTGLRQVAVVVRRVDEARDRERQYRHLSQRLGLDDESLCLPALKLCHLQTSWMQLVDNWPHLDAGCAALDSRACEVWSPTLLNDVMRGRQVLFRLVSPRRKRLIGWVRMAAPAPAPDTIAQAMSALIATAGPEGGRLARYWLRRLHHHLLMMPLTAEEGCMVD